MPVLHLNYTVTLNTMDTELEVLHVLTGLLSHQKGIVNSDRLGVLGITSIPIILCHSSTSITGWAVDPGWI